MATSPVSICNMALAMLGETQILSISPPDDIPAANLCATYYDQARDKVLADREWSFAIAWRTLPALASNPSAAYSTAFKLPVDCVRVLRVYDTDKPRVDDQNSLQWVREGNNVITDAASVTISYVRRVTDANEFSPGFVQCLAIYLASLMANSITANAGLSGQLTQRYMMELSEAAAADGMQGRNQTIRFSSLVNARYRS